MNSRDRYDISVYKRDTWDGFSSTMNYVDDAGTVLTPIDLTNSTIVMQVKVNPSDDTSVLQLSTQDNTITITDAINGKFKINSININIPSGMYYYDIQFTFLSSSKVKTYLYGTFNVTQDVTQII
jgi:hypothetical protein